MSANFNPIKIKFGSNLFLNTNGVISVKGKELFKMEVSALKPLITVEIRDQNNLLLGKMWKSTSFVHCHNAYEQIYDEQDNIIKRIALKRKADNQIIFETIFHSPNYAEINGIFFVKGINFPIIATKQYVDLNTNRFSNNVISKSGTGIEIGEDLARAR